MINPQDIEMMRALLQHISNAFVILHGAQGEIEQRLRMIELAQQAGMGPTCTPILTGLQAAQLDAMQKNIIVLRKLAIQFDVQNGLNGRDIAHMYGVTPSRISQVCSAPVTWQPIDF